MVPTRAQVEILWDKYQLSASKRRHCQLVAKLALFLAEKLVVHGIPVKIDILEAASLLHDIDKNAPKRLGDQHPDAAVRILQAEGMGEVAGLVKTHPLHTIVNRSPAPKNWEEKILFLADKMVKQEIISVDERFRLWHDEHLPPQAQVVLDASYPKVKQLEQDIFHRAEITSDDITELALTVKKSTMER